MSVALKPGKLIAEPTVSAGYAKALLDLAVARGAPAAALLERSDIDPAILADQDNRLPLARFQVLMRAAKALTGEAALALKFGETSLLAEMSIVGLISEAAETLTEALAQLNRYGRLVIEVAGVGGGDRFAVVRGEGEHRGAFWLEDRRPDPDDFPELTESTLARFACGVARQFGGPPLARAVHVTHPEPAYRSEYDRIFRAPVTFGASRNALLIDNGWTTRGTGRSNRYVFGIFSERAEALMKSLETVRTTRGRVESALIPILHTGETDMSRLARELGVSRPTLYRQLKAEGVGYEALLDDLRHRMALHYLDGQKVSVSQTAYLVGFSDPSAFSKAFKRWTGASPARRGTG